MNTPFNIQQFLLKKCKILKIKRTDLIYSTHLAPSTISRLMNGRLLNPDLITIIKIADYFQCSIDAILGRVKYQNTPLPFETLNLDIINNNLILFIQNKLKNLNISAYTLELNCKLGSCTITHFINHNSKIRILSINVIIVLADYFNVSVDDMIGRIKRM
jgi:transcriptional regulator with XRE-family HTH domain